MVDPEGREIEGVCHVVLQLQTGSEPHCVITIKNPAVKFTGEAVVKEDPAPAEPAPVPRAAMPHQPEGQKAEKIWIGDKSFTPVRVPKLEESFVSICAKCASKRGDFREWKLRPVIGHGECDQCKTMGALRNAPLLKFEDPAPPAKPEEITGHICKACAQKWDLNAWLKAPVAGIGKCDKCGINAGLRPVQMLVFPRSEPEPQKLADIDPKGGAARYSYFVDGLEVKVCYVHTTGRCLRDLLPDAKRGYAIFLESTDIEEKDRQILDETVIDLDQQFPKHFYTVPPASCGGEEPENWMCGGEGCLKKSNAPDEPWTLVTIQEQGRSAPQKYRFCLTCWRKINALIAF